MILENLEFDGSTVLCRVCGDKASGFHYGVHACEGCKGFFRRSIQQKIQYRPCLKNQECSIVRVNRNRCQYCRLKKCISVGMSRDAVRFGRVPKKEKAKIMEQMKRVNAHSELNTLQSFLENDPEFTTKIITAHFKHCDFTKQKMKGLGDAAWRIPHFINCPAQMACPLNPKADTSQSEDSGQWGDVSELFTPAIKNVVNFAKSIPGFQVFSQEDQVTLLKAGTFEVLLLHLAPLFDAKHNTMMFANGKLFKRSAYPVMSNAGFLLDSMFDFSERMQSLDLCEEEIALFSAAVIIASDRPGLRNVDIVGKVQTKVHEGLQNVLRQNHPDDKSLFPKILMKMPDLRTLSILHSEKLSGMTVTSTSGDHMGDQKDLGRTTIRCPQNSGVSATLDPCSCYVSSSDDVQTGCWRNPTKPFIPSFNRSQDSNQGIIHPAHINYQRSHVPCTSSYSINYDNVTSNKSRNKMHIPQIKNSFQQEFISDRSRITFQHNIKMEANNDFVQNLKNEGMEKINFSHPVKYLQNVVESKVGHIFQSDNSLEPMDKGICPEGDFDEERKIYRRKRAFNMSTSNTQEKIKPKMPRLQELCASETRSSRSNSVSSCSSIDSIDSAYRTMSSPSTPRSIGSIDICPPYVNKCIRDAKYNKYVSTDKETNIEPSISHIVSSSSSSSNTNASSDLIKSNRVVGTTSNWSFKKVIHVPLLKHALSVPPLCDQETWFYNPNKDTFDESHYMKQAQNQVSEIPTSLSEHDDSIVKDSNKSAEVSDADEKLPDPHVKSVEDWKLEQLHSNSLTRTQESPLSNMDLPPMYRPYYGIYPAFFYQYAALHQHIQARSHFDKFMQHLRTDPPGTEVNNLALKEESQ